MSKAVGAVGLLLISALCVEAVAGWICDGRRPASTGEVVVVGSTNCTVRADDVNGTSVVYAVTLDGHTNVVGRFRSE